ncbi:MAG: hypothetical protein COU08_01990 [Candidatus Harrisonbacteria bacterium CG10_big_fil_rev_8_21_14_0_10_42_17]|uniref:Uncharacterized protein n=1 Tax=Candidatus Harrisonbacteria bacterium CG10_big_fil_rev_8_21_14_0_10_42_17 TaxID=1974584 RepID=A0A2M6WIA3_9BACT|nr:MAG: hypothetical protein COU08_01990 [Candidatus Harrisonbacteria bacterium CG10_big_fil_rev_8_21_14_0_10_42_17]
MGKSWKCALLVRLLYVACITALLASFVYEWNARRVEWLYEWSYRDYSEKLRKYGTTPKEYENDRSKQNRMFLCLHYAQQARFRNDEYCMKSIFGQKT